MTSTPSASRRISRTSSSSSGVSNSMFTDSAWPTMTGTRTAVAVSLIDGSKIFLVSIIIFHSSLV